MILTERIEYSESDIPAKNMRLWIDKAYPLFELFVMSNNGVDAIEPELLNKILPESNDSEKIVIKTTEVHIQIDYSISDDDIKLFADYIMDLNEDEHSFYFVYAYEINRHLFGKKLAESYDKIKQRFSDLHAPNKEVKLRYLQEQLVNIFEFN